MSPWPRTQPRACHEANCPTALEHDRERLDLGIRLEFLDHGRFRESDRRGGGRAAAEGRVSAAAVRPPDPRATTSPSNTRTRLSSDVPPATCDERRGQGQQTEGRWL